jgi:hypothetical protein
MKKRPQQSLDDKATYDRERRTFEGASDIKTHPTSQAYRDGWERVFGHDLKHKVSTTVLKGRA